MLVYIRIDRSSQQRLQKSVKIFWLKRERWKMINFSLVSKYVEYECPKKVYSVFS